MAKKTVMIVDDEYLILETVKEVLENGGYNVNTALSGKEALKKLKKEMEFGNLVENFDSQNVESLE